VKNTDKSERTEPATKSRQLLYFTIILHELENKAFKDIEMYFEWAEI
jgi:hypothetical protein